MFCQKCGEDNKDGAAFCNKCGTYLTGSSPSTADREKHNSVIEAKIKTKRDQINDISQIGPLLMIFIGLPALFFYIIPGLVLMGVGILWSNSRESDRKRLENEIKELQAQLV